MGFLGPDQSPIKQAGLETDPRSNIKTPGTSYATSIPGVFAAGDCRRGQSLIGKSVSSSKPLPHL